MTTPARASKKRAPTKTARSPKKRTARQSKPATRGQRLWAAHHDQVDGERGLVLLEEACRIADRLDLLDALVKGDAATWCTLTEGRDGTLELRIDSALVEARQQANVLRQLIASLPLKEVSDGGGGDGGDWATHL